MARWWSSLTDLADRVRIDQLSLTAAGVAFFAMLGLLPGLLALITLYALFADPRTLRAQLEPALAAMPDDATALIERQLESMLDLGQEGLTFALLASLLILLWSAAIGTRGLIAGVNRAYGRTETRSFVRRQALALLLSVVGILVTATALAAIAVVPAVLNVLGVEQGARWVLLAGRWAVILALVTSGLAVLYRYGPSQGARWSWVSAGSVTAIALWLAGSVAFSFFVDNLAQYQATYGALSGLVVLMLWLYLSSFVVLLGAEIDARDTRAAAPPEPVRGPRSAVPDRGG